MISQECLERVDSGDRRRLKSIPNESWYDISSTHELFNSLLAEPEGYFIESYLRLLHELQLQREKYPHLLERSVPGIVNIKPSSRVEIWFEKAAAMWGQPSESSRIDNPPDVTKVNLFSHRTPTVVGYKSHESHIAYSYRGDGNFFVINRSQKPKPSLAKFDQSKFATPPPEPPHLTPENNGLLVIRAAMAQQEAFNDLARLTREQFRQDWRAPLLPTSSARLVNPNSPVPAGR